MFVNSPPVPPAFYSMPRSAKIKVRPKTKPYVWLKSRPTLSNESEPVALSPKRTQSSESKETKLDRSQLIEVVGTAKLKIQRRREQRKVEKKPAEASLNQADILIERSLRGLGCNLKAFSQIAVALDLRLQHKRSRSQQFLSSFVYKKRSNSELRMSHLKHILDEPFTNFRAHDLTTLSTRLSNLILPSASQLSMADMSFNSITLGGFLRPNTTPGKWKPPSLASNLAPNEHGAKITDTAYNLLLLKTLEQIFKLSGDVKCESYYDKDSQALTSLLTGNDAPLSDCCKSHLQVKLTELSGCRVICTKSGCQTKTVTNFVLPLLLRQRLWRAKPLVQEPMSARQVSLNIATGKYRSFSFRNSARSASKTRNRGGLEPSHLYLTEIDKSRIFSNERLQVSTAYNLKRTLPTEYPSKMLLPKRRALRIACNPLQVMLAKQKGLYSPTANLHRRAALS